MKRSIYIGYDPREVSAFAVARSSIARRNGIIPIYGLVLEDLRSKGIYKRPTSWSYSPRLMTGEKSTVMIDELSKRDDYDGRVSTEFAISRFLTPMLAGTGMALFLDSDVLVLEDIARLFEIGEANQDKALFCVHHNYAPLETVKMDNQVQVNYDRKNWSSVMLFNCDHPSNKKLTLEMINTFPGRDLHRFCWLDNTEIGELDNSWNVLVGHTKCNDPKIIHFTSGGPWFQEYSCVQYADKWQEELIYWAKRWDLATSL